MTQNTRLMNAILDLPVVESLQHFDYVEEPKDGFTLLPFLCPFRYKPYNVVKNDQDDIIGVTTGYRDGITAGSKAKMDLVKSFWDAGASTLLGNSTIRFLMGDSDVYACSSIFPKAPALPAVEDFEIVSNKQVWEQHDAVLELEKIVDDWYDTYSCSIQDVIKQERDGHLCVDGDMYHPDVPKDWKEKMIKRIISSYMLDGILMRRGVYGPNPVILGVEATSTTIIQNAGLTEDQKIPVIMLRHIDGSI